MRKLSLLLVMLLWNHAIVNAQEMRERKVMFDLQLAQSIGINDWSRVKFASDRLPRASSLTDLRATFNLYVIRRTTGIFYDIGVGIMPAPRNGFSDPATQATVTSGIPYYTKEIIEENGSESASAHFKMTFGFFSKFSITDKFSMSPSLGAGLMTTFVPACEAVLKEHNSNMQYIARYHWFGQDEYGYSYKASLGYLAFRLRFAYHIMPKSNLLFGIEYTLFPVRAEFSESYTNYFNHNLTKTINHAGNRLNMLGISLGVTFNA